MDLNESMRRGPPAAFALILVLVFAGAALMVLCGVIGWSTSKVRLGGRQNQLQNVISAAEAATEKVIARMAQDFQQLGGPALDTNLAAYSALVPTLSDSSLLANYAYTDTNGNPNKVSITKLLPWQYTNLDSTFAGLQGTVVKYSIVSRAFDTSTSANLGAGVEQDIEFASLPVFQFQVFYAPDLEICPGGNLKFTGRVHGNGNVYVNPNLATVTFQGPVTASQQVLQQKSPLDPSYRTGGAIVYQGDCRNRIKTLNPPIGTNISPIALAQLIRIPPGSESRTSQLGQQRLYNKADLVILVYSNQVVATSGAYNNFATSLPWGGMVQTFLNTNQIFADWREGMYMLAAQLDINQFNNQYANLTAILGRPPKTVYLANLWLDWNYEMAVRLVNGQTLPSQGLTVVSPNPAYIWGHYNCPTAQLGTTNTANTAPAAVIADAITVLSHNWNDGNSAKLLSSRLAASTTVNAALMGGVVPSNGWYFSGGVENMTRLLEDWTGDTLTHNGSLVVLYPSQIAVGPWGASSQVYKPPTRNWSFDPNFLNGAKLPSSTPELRTIIRSAWLTLRAK